MDINTGIWKPVIWSNRFSKRKIKYLLVTHEMCWCEAWNFNTMHIYMLLYRTYYKKLNILHRFWQNMNEKLDKGEFLNVDGLFMNSSIHVNRLYNSFCWYTPVIEDRSILLLSCLSFYHSVWQVLNCKC